MRDGNGQKPYGPEHPLGNGKVRALAERAIAVLAAETHPGASAVRRFRLSEFCDALSDADPDRYKSLVGEFVDYGLGHSDIYEDLVPNAARMLGERWSDDKMSFAEVTIGTARLQEIIRSVEQRYILQGEAAPIGHHALLAVPGNEDHTLGAIVAAGHLRRHGLWVRLLLGASLEELSVAVQETPFSFIGLSVGSEKALGFLPDLVSHLKQLRPKTPIVIGGSAIVLPVDVLAVTGADLVSSDPQEIFDFCGIDPSPTVRDQD